MRRVVYMVALTLLLVGCGGGGTSGSSGGDSSKEDENYNTPTEFDGYVLYEYLVPKKTKEVTVYKYINDKFDTVESLSYNKSDYIVIQRSKQNLGGKAEYQNNGGDEIDITVFDGIKQKSFKMKNFLYIGDVVTVENSTCVLKSHKDEFSIDDKKFKDVLEIKCPTSIGYYQKGVGLVVEKDLKNIESNDLDMVPNYDRKLGLIDKLGNSRLSVYNLDSVKESNVDKLWRSPYFLTGQGMKIGLVDGGSVRSTHVELRGRVHNLSNSDTNLHATHVAGTLISSGVHLYTSRGFAKDAHIYVLDYSDQYFADSIKRLFEEEGVLISNHSYGFEGSEGLGEYDGDSKKFDKTIYDNPYLIAVLAAGNDGEKYSEDSSFTEWFLIKGGANAKNVITVASVDDRSDYVNRFSSRGPIKVHGRLKPDISMDGYNVLSTSDYDDTAYKRMFGTSMAAPAATGAVTLLSQRYKELTGAYPRVDTIKAILFNTARDIENPGPDYKSGFGAIDALKAVEVIDTLSGDNPLIRLDTIYKNEEQKYFISNSQYRDFKVTISWVDDTVDDCTGCANDKLLNDIDSYIENVDTGEIIYPYTLNMDHPSWSAVKDRQNHVDPQEQIEFRMTPGNYILHITASKLSNISQDFTIVSNTPLSEKETNIKIVPMREHIHKIFESIK
jgi:subtilisin family serine protease